MSSAKDYEFDYIERYYGPVAQVKKIIENCPCCGSKMIITHQCDCSSLLVHETAQCADCDFGARKLIHKLN